MNITILRKCLILLCAIYVTLSASYGNEVIRKKLYVKIYKALQGNEENMAPIVIKYFHLLDYQNNNIITFKNPRVVGESDTSDKTITLPVVFLRAEDETTIKELKKNNLLTQTLVKGYVDDEYHCFVCFNMYTLPPSMGTMEIP